MELPLFLWQNAHAAGLKVHPYTFRAENPFLPSEFRSEDLQVQSYGNLSGEIRAFLAAGIDGLFVDQPDVPTALRGVCVNIPSGVSGLLGVNYFVVVALTLVVISSRR